MKRSCLCFLVCETGGEDAMRAVTRIVLTAAGVGTATIGSAIAVNAQYYYPQPDTLSKAVSADRTAAIRLVAPI